MNKVLIIVIMLSLPNVMFGCTCYMIESFDIQWYDESEIIAEVKVLEKIEDDYDVRLAQYQKDTINWNNEHPPLPLSPPKNFTEFKVEIIEVFKGGISLESFRLRALERNSSCFWEPKVGISYVFYLSEVIDQVDGQILVINGCQRRVRGDAKNFDLEREALKIIGGTKEGRFVLNQGELTSYYNGDYFSLKGRFKDGKKHGKWILAEPLSYARDLQKPRRKVIVIRYKKGELISVKYFKPNNRSLDKFMVTWRFYFEEKKL